MARGRSAFSRCIGKHLRGKRGGRTAFKRAVRACKRK